MQKRVDNALYRALRLTGMDQLKYGAAESVGLSIGGVELADNENYKKLVPQDIRDKVAAKSKDDRQRRDQGGYGNQITGTTPRPPLHCDGEGEPYGEDCGVRG